MRDRISRTFQVAAVFIGTIVGAGLASGKEIAQFFTSYGYKSFIGILICGVIYILVCSMFVKISIKYNLKSYNELIMLISPGFLGQITDFFTSFFLMSGAAIIMAGSGALIHQYFGVSRWIGIAIMVIFTILVLLKDTQGVIGINSFIVPSLIIVISTIFILYMFFAKDYMTISHLKTVPYYKQEWFFSTLLYASFNILCCSGVLVPLTSEFRKPSTLILGIILGSIGLTLLCGAINLMLMLNIPYIYKYEIPLLYISHRFGKAIQVMLLSIIWLEMFTTEISDIYSVSKMLETVSQKARLSHNTKGLRRFIANLSYRKSIFIIILIAIPISQIGFSRLISILYPSFGVVSIVFIVQCSYFYCKNIKSNVFARNR